ncbi:MAG: hypothetical protein KTR22_14045 [Flavobacteriaceae bacterium]|nr:hypothetical protein [Flavobacteriaceae bacterium]
MSTSTSDNGKTVAIISYLTLIGWIIALIMNNSDKTELGSFHIRQMLGIMLIAVALSVVSQVLGIGIVAWVIQIALLVLWILGFIGALQGEKKPIPVLGEQFQEWFKGIG